MTAAALLHAVMAGEPISDDAVEFLKAHGLVTRRKGKLTVTAAGRALAGELPPAARVETCTREELAARLPPQPDSPWPIG